jgi:hypothetical protein
MPPEASGCVIMLQRLLVLLVLALALLILTLQGHAQCFQQLQGHLPSMRAVPKAGMPTNSRGQSIGPRRRQRAWGDARVALGSVVACGLR